MGEEEEHIKLIQMNEEENARIAKRRTDRLLIEAEERRLKINADLDEAKIEEEQRLQVAGAVVEVVAAEMETRIKEEEVERAIEIALANPIDFEYAIDKEGRIFNGRKTLCNLLDKTEVKKIPEPTAEEKFILQN